VDEAAALDDEGEDLVGVVDDELVGVVLDGVIVAIVAVGGHVALLGLGPGA
jgi:hypothetical protein